MAKEEGYTLNRAFDTYTKNRLFTHDIAKTTQDNYVGCYNRHIAPVLGKIPIKDITPPKINDFLDSLSDSACNVSITVLKRIQKVAIRGGKITTPFCFDTDKRRIGKRDRVIDDLPYFLDWLSDIELY